MQLDFSVWLTCHSCLVSRAWGLGFHKVPGDPNSPMYDPNNGESNGKDHGK